MTVLLDSRSTGLKKAIRYAGLVYYYEDGVEDLVTFSAVKKLNTLLEVIHSMFHHYIVHCLYSLLRKNIHKLNKDLIFTFILHLLVMVLLN